QIETTVGVRRLDLLRRERPERSVQHSVVGGERHDELVRIGAKREERLDPDLQIVEVAVRHVEPRGQTAGDEVRDRPEILLGRNDQPDLVRGHLPASRSSSASARSRRAAASFPPSTPGRQSRLTLKSAKPKLTPAAMPETFCTGRVMAKFT